MIRGAARLDNREAAGNGEPPESTSSVPPEMPVPEPGAPLVRPPDSTNSVPPVSRPTLLVIVPNTLSVPPLDTVKWLVPPSGSCDSALREGTMVV